MTRRHLTRTFVTSESNEDRCVARLAENGTTGVEVQILKPGEGASQSLRLIAYFEETPEPHQGLPSALGETVDGIQWLAEEWVEDRDWQAEFRRRSQPIPVGERFLVDPGEIDTAAPSDGERLLLRLPARTAFGTGSHETTQLTLEWLEKIPLRSCSVLDVGSGSGILTFAAHRLGARRVVGFDHDLPSALMSGQYERLNRSTAARDGGRILLYGGTVSALRLAGQFDVLLVNVLPHRVAADLPQLVRGLRSGATVVVSGLLESEAEAVLETWVAMGWHPEAQKQRGDWVAWRLSDRRQASLSSSDLPPPGAGDQK